jgi:hypothetical protein
MANRIQIVTYRNDGTNRAEVVYDVLDNTGTPTKLGGTITVPLTAVQAATFIGSVPTVVDAKVAIDRAAWQAQATNTAPK